MDAERSHALVQHVARALARAGVLRSQLVLGLSGGIDSMVLLDVLAHLRCTERLDVRALHVNHRLLRQAPQWAATCAARCERLQVPFEAVEVEVRNKEHVGPEAAARAARYAVFRTQSARALILAHHLDDQAETVLLQLARGAGPQGLAAMPLVRVLDPKSGLLLVRPMLQLARAEIEAYARDRRIEWVDDPSNTNLDLDRNYLRHRVLPLVAQRFPSYAQSFSRAAANAGDALEIVDAMARSDAESACSGSSLRLDRLRQLVPSRARNLLRWFLVQRGLQAPARGQLDEILRQLLEARRDAQPTFRIGGWRIYRHSGALRVQPDTEPPARNWSVAWHGEAEVDLPARLGKVRFTVARGVGLSKARLLSARCVLRGRGGGERMRLASNRPARPLKKLLQEAGVPAWRRESLPLLFVADELAWVPGVGVLGRLGAAADEEGVLLEWIEPPA